MAAARESNPVANAVNLIFICDEVPVLHTDAIIGQYNYVTSRIV